MFFQSYIFRLDFLMHQKTSHVIDLADERPRIATEILAHVQGVLRNDECVVVSVKISPIALREYSRPGGIVTVVSIDIPVDVVVIRAVGGDDVLIVLPALVQPLLG